MARFKRLGLEELELLEEQFIQYLASQGITGSDWAKLQKDDAAMVEQHLDAFSDLVYGSVMREAKFLEHRDQLSVSCFQLLEEKAVVVRLEVEPETSEEQVDLRDPQIVKELASGHMSTKVRVYTTDKPWTRAREDEVFEMMQHGAEITDGALFRVLCQLL